MSGEIREFQLAIMLSFGVLEGLSNLVPYWQQLTKKSVSVEREYVSGNSCSAKIRGAA